MSEPLADVIARMQERMRPHAVSPVIATRKATDTVKPGNGGPSGDRGSVLNGTRLGTGGHSRVNTNASRRNGGKYGGTFRPTSAHFAGNPVPATQRATAPDIKRSNGIRVAGYVNAADARVIGDDNGYRQWVSARANLMRDAGDETGTGESYPGYLTRHGNLGPQARY